MVCAARQEIQVTQWGWCFQWGFIPYPCRKTTTVIRYQYDFRPWRTRFSWSPFRRKYQGCCGGLLYEWAYWTWSPSGTGNGPWVDNLWTYFSEGPIGSIGNCPFNGGDVFL